jgi:hypothetical protein
MAQLYFDRVIKTLQILGKEHGTQDAHPSCLVILSTASVSEASKITPGVGSGVTLANANRSDVRQDFGCTPKTGIYQTQTGILVLD